MLYNQQFLNNIHLPNEQAYRHPATPTLFQEWKAAAGVAKSEGIIEVTTTTFGTGFKHTIVLKKVKIVRGSDDFLLGESGENFSPLDSYHCYPKVLRKTQNPFVSPCK